MNKCRSAACAVIGTALLLSVVGSASATDQATQAMPGAEGVSQLFVGIDDQGTATAVWGDRFGSPIEYSTRSVNGRFGTPVAIPGTERVSESVFDEVSNGNAVFAWLDTSQAEPQIRASVKLGRASGFRTHQIVHESAAENIYGVDTATSASGRSVIVWTELQTGGVLEIRGSLSNSSGVFGAPVTIGSGGDFAAVDMGADGSALAVWDVDTQSDDRVMASGAPAGQPFGAERLIETLDQGPGRPDVAVNASNQAVVAYDDGTPEPCPNAPNACAGFWIEVQRGTVTGAFTPVGGLPTNAESGYGFVSHQVELDDSGKAAVLASGSTPDLSYGVLARTSDAAGTFGPLQEISGEGQLGGPGNDLREMELAAGGGEFTAIWWNDHDADGANNEAYMSSTSEGTFGAPHQVSQPTDSSFLLASAARNAAGDVVGVWSTSTDELALVTPVNLQGTAQVIGTNGADQLTGTSGPDVARLGGGNDVFNGAGGNDKVFGQAGSDRISGGAGGDFLDGGPGKNVLNGGPGRDTCVKRSKRDRLESCERVRREPLTTSQI